MTSRCFTSGALAGLLIMLTSYAPIAFGEETDTTLYEEKETAEHKTPADITRTAIQILFPAIDNFELDVMRYPTEQEGLNALLANPGLNDWNGPYVKEEKELVDGWDIPLKYLSSTGMTYNIISAGPDRVFGTADDARIEY